MAHKKGAGSTKNGRESQSKRLGLKKHNNQLVTAGNIIVRQRGHKYKIGTNTYMGKDHTIHASINGIVSFQRKREGSFVSILPLPAKSA